MPKRMACGGIEPPSSALSPTRTNTYPNTYLHTYPDIYRTPCGADVIPLDQLAADGCEGGVLC